MHGWRWLTNVGKCSSGRAFSARRSFQSYSWKCSPEGALADTCHSLQRSIGVHVFHAADQLGIVATISQMIARSGANVLNVDIHVDFDNGVPFFYSRRWQEGQLPADIRAVISNHPRGPNTHVWRFLDRHGIPYHYLPTTKGDNKEEEILEIVKDTDFLVLARYMQVLSPEFLSKYGRDVINIHHGLLPSFKGANPYRQAYRAGVKLIGATAHFVTDELDDGPIIEQMVERVSHRDTVHSFAMKSENLERQCLAKAIKYYCEQRIIRYSKNKTIIFN